MKRKNIFKSLLGAAMALIMIFGAAPLSGFVGIRLPMLSLKAEAAITGTTEDGLFEYEVGKHETDSGYQYGVTITRYKGPDSGEVVIPKIIAGYEVKWIGYAAFLDCIGITSIVIPDGVMTIAMGAFLRCKGIKSVVFPESMTGICDSAFAGCTNLKEVIIPNVTYIDKSAFSGCTSLSKVEFSDRLEVIDERAFSNCNSLKSIIIPKNTIGICEYAFANCTSLEKIEIKSGATTIYEKAFDGCVNLKELTIRSYVEEEDIKRFSSCTNLESITVDSVSESDGDPWWIWFCSRLPKLANINILSNDKKYSSIDGVLCNKDGSELLLYPKGNKRSTYTVPDGVTKINYEAFSGCQSLKEITIPDSVTGIDGSAFDGCTSLSKVKLSNNLTYISGEIFYGCTSLTEITIPDSVTSIGGSAFEGCTSLSKVQLSNGLAKIGDYAFGRCENLAEITIPDSVTEIGESAFSGCTSLKEITVSPDNKNYVSVDGVLFSKDMSILLAYPAGNKRSTYTVPDGVTKIEYGAFCDCTSLTEITVSPNNKNYSSFGGVLFNKSRSKLLKYPIGNECRAYIVPDGVAEIGSSAFDGCTSLEEITIPESIRIIGSSAFNNCSGMKNIYYLGTQEQWRRVIINESWDETLTVHYIDDGHSWGEWEIIEKATFEKEGLKRRVCSLCNAEETRIIPKLVKATKIDLSHNEKTIIVGKTFTITAIVKPEEASNRTVTWSSSNPSIATVDEDGTVTAIAKGEAIITAESTDGIKAECRIIVENESVFTYEIN
ncbi:MAG TPA: hypothetical protein DHW68_07505 [Ruminococcaceae bacterium]|nr:hypothetical protein [Oscillospiraceae bacterium]